MRSRFAATFTKFVQSQLFFNIYRVFGSNVISALANRTLEIKQIPITFLGHNLWIIS